MFVMSASAGWRHQTRGSCPLLRAGKNKLARAIELQTELSKLRKICVLIHKCVSLTQQFLCEM